MRHTYQHIHPDGSTQTAIVAYDGDNLAIVMHPPHVAPQYQAEFDVWIHEVLVPSLQEVLPEEAQMMLVSYVLGMAAKPGQESDDPPEENA